MSRRRLIGDLDELRRLYVDERLPQRAIAARLGVSVMAVSVWLRRSGVITVPGGWGLSRRRSSEAEKARLALARRERARARFVRRCRICRKRLVELPVSQRSHAVCSERLRRERERRKAARRKEERATRRRAT